MATKYYHAENAGRPIAGVYFNGYAVSAGTLLGVYATDNAMEINALDAAASSPPSGVTAISASEYDSSLKKKQPGLVSSTASKPPLPPPLPIKGTGAAVVVSEPAIELNSDNVDDTIEMGSTLESSEQAIKVEEIQGRPI